MRRCRRNLSVLVLVTCGVCTFLCSLSVFLLPHEQEPEERRLQNLNQNFHRHIKTRNVIMNGQREILNINSHPPAIVATISSSNSPLDDPKSSEAKLRVTTRSEVVSLPANECSGPWEGYPQCESKMAWMAKFWQSDPCYKRLSVNGSRCSFQLYLSTVEHWCPPLPNSALLSVESNKIIAAIQHELEPLTVRLSANAKFDWISRRIQRSWPEWIAALKALNKAKHFNLQERRVLIHIGALTDKAGFKFAENADHGGPLGELVQWSDLIACLHLLGHKVQFSSEMDQLRGYLGYFKMKESCQFKPDTGFDVIYTDIVGLKQFKKIIGSRLIHYKCLFRVLDSFGTEPQFNFKRWKPVGISSIRKKEYGQTWGNWELNPRQFLTMYPHTPDNSFLGFVVGSQKVNDSAVTRRKNVSLVYGKELYMWKDKRTYLDVISRFFDIHATIGNTTQKKQDYDMSIIPGFVYNHGILKASELQDLLKETKVFVGLGFPYEGPAPLEAIASGCFFLNPRIDPPINRYNSKFFKGKPTLRSLTSQNPYTEMFIGAPYVYTVDIDNTSELASVLKTMASLPNPPPYLPYEFTYEGMLERVAVLLENQDFCSFHQWPPVTVLETRVSNKGESCKDACYREGMVCEPELFHILNSGQALQKHNLPCDQVVTEHSVHGPSFDIESHTCSVQLDRLLLSCVGSEPVTQRLCPCRRYRKGQIVLCETC